MTMEQIDMALTEIINQTGIGQFELVGFDACLMAQVESLSVIAPHARYTVASEETEPALGWAYASICATSPNKMKLPFPLSARCSMCATANWRR